MAYHSARTLGTYFIENLYSKVYNSDNSLLSSPHTNSRDVT